MPICESPIPKVTARSHFCRHFPRSIFLKGSQSSGSPHISTFFVHDGAIPREKEGDPIGINRRFAETVLFHDGRSPEASLRNAQ